MGSLNKKEFSILKINALTAAYHCKRDLHAKFTAHQKARIEQTICFTNEFVQNVKTRYNSVGTAAEMTIIVT